jgi:hypothetical protein
VWCEMLVRIYEYIGRGVMCVSLSNDSLALQTEKNVRIHLDLHFSGMLAA